MKRVCLSSTFVCTLLLLSGFVFADNSRGFYAGGSAGVVFANDLMIADPLDNDKDLVLGALEVMGGYKYNSLLGMDVRIGAGLLDSSLRISESAKAEYQVDNYYSVYYRPEIINKFGSWYGLIGYTNLSASIETVNNDGDVSATGDFSESGLSYGFGIGWFYDNNVNFHAEVRNLLDKDDVSLTIFNLGFNYRF